MAAPETASLEADLKGQKLKAAVPVTGDYGNFKWTELGSLDIPETGKTSLSLRGVPDGWHPVNVRSIRLKPIQ